MKEEMVMPMNPTIDAGSLHLRLPKATDKSHWLAVANQPDVLALGLLDFELAMRNWEDQVYGLFVVTESSSGKVLGIAGAARPFRCIGPHLLAALHPEARTKPLPGSDTLGVLACRAVVSWCHDAVDLQLFAHVEPPNEKGHRLALTLGGHLLPEDSELRLPGYDSSVQADYVFHRPSSAR